MKKILSLLIISGLLLVSCGKTEVEEKKFFQTYTVNSGTLSSGDNILGSVEGTNTSQIGFKSPGRIKDILVKEGDTVKKDQILATLGNEEAGISYNGASSILSEIGNMGVDVVKMGNDTQKIKDAVSNLYDQRLGLLDENYKKAQIGVTMAEKDLALAKSNLTDNTSIFSSTVLNSEQKIEQAENAYNMAKSNLENSKALLNQEKDNINRDAINSLTNAYIIARNARDFIDNILGITDANKYKNDGYEVYLGAKNSSTKIQAEKDFNVFNSSYTETYKLYQDKIAGKESVPENELKEILNKALTTLNLLRDSLHSLKDTLDNSIISSNFSESSLNDLKNQASTILSNLEQAIISPTAVGMVGVKGSIQAMESFSKNYDLKVKQLEDAFSISSKDLEMAKTGKNITTSDVNKNTTGLQTNIKIKEDALELAKIGVTEVLKNIELVKQEKISKLSEINASLGEISSKLSELDSKKAEANMNKNMAENMQESGIIKAPFDGIITKKMMEPGVIVGAGIPVLIMTSIDKKLIKTYIDNSKYNFNIGKKIDLISEKDNKITEGKITYIGSGVDLVSKKNYIEIEVIGENIKIGDKFLLQIGEKKQANNLIPISSVIYKYSQPGVLILNGNKAEFKIIKILDQDNSFASVEGIKNGEKVITEGKDNIIDGETLK